MQTFQNCLPKKPQLPNKWVEGISVNDSLSLAAEISLQGRLKAVLILFPLAAKRAHESQKYIHLLRVWTRRASTAITLYRDQLPCRTRERVKKTLRRIRGTVNDARDSDVLIKRLEKSMRKSQETRSAGVPCLADKGDRPVGVYRRWLKDLRQQRIVAQSQILKCYQKASRQTKLSRTFNALILKIKHAESQADDEGASSFKSWARLKINEQFTSFFKAIPSDFTDLTRLHRFRIQTKKLRYAIELLALAFPPVLADVIYPKIAALQAELGEINDLAVSCRQLKEKQHLAKKSNQRKQWRIIRRKKKKQLNQAVQTSAKTFETTYLNELRVEIDSLLNLK